MRETETGWILDDGNMAIGTCGNKLTVVTYTDPCCIRFSRAWDAENFRQALYNLGFQALASAVKPEEHLWEERLDHHEKLHS